MAFGRGLGYFILLFSQEFALSLDAMWQQKKKKKYQVTEREEGGGGVMGRSLSEVRSFYK